MIAVGMYVRVYKYDVTGAVLGTLFYPDILLPLIPWTWRTAAIISSGYWTIRGHTKRVSKRPPRRR